MRSMPQIDRDIFRKVRKDGTGRFTLRFICLVLTIILIFSILALVATKPTSETVKSPSTISYVTHNPITIAGNNGFKGSNTTTGISRGNGTAGNPYIIEGWLIDAHGNSSAISIASATVYFKIMNCRLYNASSAGITLSFVSHGQLLNNNCTANGMAGIYLAFCDDDVVFNNSCTMNANFGVELFFSDGIYISSNYCAKNGADSADSGIYVRNSRKNNITTNVLNDNPIGIMLEFSYSNNFSFNNLSMNTGYGIKIDKTSGKNHIWNNTFFKNNGSGDTFDVMKIQAFDSVGNNSWNSSGPSHGYGNYWSDWTGPDIASPLGIVDSPYNVTGGAGAKDYFPLTSKPTPPIIPEFGLLIVPIFAAMITAIAIARKRAHQ